MNEDLSSLFDGEIEVPVARRMIAHMAGDFAVFDAWRTAALIGDAMRGDACRGSGATASFHARLAEEPTVLCPPPIRRLSASGSSVAWAAAASIAGIAVVVLAVYGMQAGHGFDTAAHDTVPTSVTSPRFGGNAGAEEFMLAHQAVSPSGAMSGFSHYARTVALASAEGTGRR